MIRPHVARPWRSQHLLLRRAERRWCKVTAQPRSWPRTYNAGHSPSAASLVPIYTSHTSLPAPRPPPLRPRDRCVSAAAQAPAHRSPTLLPRLRAGHSRGHRVSRPRDRHTLLHETGWRCIWATATGETFLQGRGRPDKRELPSAGSQIGKRETRNDRRECINHHNAQAPRNRKPRHLLSASFAIIQLSYHSHGRARCGPYAFFYRSSSS
jgi:hypothetical protein